MQEAKKHGIYIHIVAKVAVKVLIFLHAENSVSSFTCFGQLVCLRFSSCPAKIAQIDG